MGLEEGETVPYPMMQKLKVRSGGIHPIMMSSDGSPPPPMKRHTRLKTVPSRNLRMRVVRKIPFSPMKLQRSQLNCENHLVSMNDWYYSEKMMVLWLTQKTKGRFWTNTDGLHQWRIQDFPEGGRQLFMVSTYERHVTSLHNQQAKTSHVIFM